MTDIGLPPAQRREPSSRTVTIAVIAALALLYTVTGKLGLRMAFLHVSATPVWPPAGIAFAALLLFGYRAWPGVFIGAFWVNITTAGSVASTLGIAAGNTLAAIVAMYLVRRFAHGHRAFQRAQDVIKLWVLAGIVSGAVAATFGATSLCLTGFAPWPSYPSLWRTWWLGDATGGFLVGSFIILWATDPRVLWGVRKTVEAALLFVALVSVTLMVFVGWFGQAYLCLPLLLWAAFRFGTRETVTAALILCGIAIWTTQRGLGPFASTNLNESLLELQVFIMVSAATMMVVATLIGERRRAAHALLHAHDRLEQRVEQRTEQLSRLNEALRSEVEERVRAQEQLATAARRRQDDLREFALSVQRAQEEERRRIARELHDGLGQRLSGLKMALQLLEDDASESGGAPSSRLEQLSRDIDRMIVEVRRLSYNLRPAALDDFGLASALEMLGNEFEKQYGIETRFFAEAPGDARHDPHIDIALYRIVQEALTNAGKHAAASTVSVELHRRADSIVLIIEDNGRGFDVDEAHRDYKTGSGFGLVGMMERIQLLGGRFELRSSVGAGTRIEANLPLPSTTHDDAN